MISVQEIRSGSVLGILKEDDLAQLLQEFDLDGDGQIDFHEFKEMMSTSLGADSVRGRHSRAQHDVSPRLTPRRALRRAHTFTDGLPASVNDRSNAPSTTTTIA